MSNLKLGVDINYFAAIRESRHTSYPDILKIARIAANVNGVSHITAHLNRHYIHDSDMIDLICGEQHNGFLKINMEMTPTEEMVQFALKYRPYQVTIRTDGENGLDVTGHGGWLYEKIKRLHRAKIKVNLSVKPANSAQIDAASHAGADAVELHASEYAREKNEYSKAVKLLRLIETAKYAHETHNLQVNVARELNYDNIHGILMIPYLNEVNIGHAIVSASMYVGVEQAVREMTRILSRYGNDATNSILNY